MEMDMMTVSKDTLSIFILGFNPLASAAAASANA